MIQLLNDQTLDITFEAGILTLEIYSPVYGLPTLADTFSVELTDDEVSDLSAALTNGDEEATIGALSYYVISDHIVFSNGDDSITVYATPRRIAEGLYV